MCNSPYAEDIPVWLTRLDFHCGLANSKALELAGITVDSSVESGVFEKNEKGTKQPTASSIRDERR